MDRDECAAVDVDSIVFYMEKYLKRRGAVLGQEPYRIVSHILRYIQLRQNASFFDISLPRSKPYKPDSWSAKDEEIWGEWLAFHCTLDSWQNEVMMPVFGSEVRLWEVACEGWRDELLCFLPWWVQRSMKIVHAFNPTQLEEEVEEDNKTGIDSYIMDHGSAKQQKAALRSGL